MVNQQVLQGNWNEIAGKIREKWGQFSDDDLQQYKGNLLQLVGFLQRKTGEAASEIERFLDDATENGSAAFSRAAEKTQGYANQAAQAAKETVGNVADRMRDGYENVEEIVQSRPTGSVAAAFGAGLVSGIVLALLFRSR